ncbi:bifunctional proline dehydrogenase/L-glutamate gamma-semialdehyde dehydrogenase PutA [Thiolinea disciformis]|uniref:bifunctional proline dehydrogenase/L-glutamate gamma-semialdehyde dehydrogenase PutA n=1 Tax=Thiolinea disciformis TaxID=125614 RepID=UPI00036A79AB|nr:bifunctional proline dehydrogenase/L-glutamate gamma-semialdehyde dehydrogenase PutA [Thiolinea disciformis]
MPTEKSLTALDIQRVVLNEAWFRTETEVVLERLNQHGLDEAARARIRASATAIVSELRTNPHPNLMERFLAEYGLSSDEGIALMCLAEAYLRVPDTPTLDALIRDKIGGVNWSKHSDHQADGSLLVNASTWALMLTGKIFREDEQETSSVIGGILKRLIQRVGEPVVRTAVSQAMKAMGQQFVLGQTIEEAFSNGQNLSEKGYLFSFDMLGEAARTEADARRYFRAYSKAISAIAEQASETYVHDNSGISVKLSALHPRYETTQRERVMNELVPRLASLAMQARNANIPFNIDAEEAERLDLSLQVIEAVLRTPDFKGWDGFGIVVQAYAKHCLPVLEWVKDLAQSLKRKIAVRLVKGAYWDAEIKQAQVQGLPAYPVFTRKTSTDVSYLAGARFLLNHREDLYPQFATHNAQTIAAILAMAGEEKGFELQRLHGMGEALHELIRVQQGKRTRIYAPVGEHEDLLAYLVRRLLENGANSSFVHQLLNEDIPVTDIVQDPISVTETLAQANALPHPSIPLPEQLFASQGRLNSQGFNVNNPLMAATIEANIQVFHTHRWQAYSIIEGVKQTGTSQAVFNPANTNDQVGTLMTAAVEQVELALQTASAAFTTWNQTPVIERASLLEKIANVYEAHTHELIALLSREAGKTRWDGVLEVREAVDFLRYYAAEARAKLTHTQGRGVFVCISPWNFPLAIFTGQIAATLVAGNTVIAKPAEQTPLIATRAVEMMLTAGLPSTAISLLLGDGATVGAALTRDKRIAGVCFTGSTDTAHLIDKAMAEHGNAQAPLIAETGGLNAMIVDSTALPEAAVRDVVSSAFQSAGQRCSALRALFVQSDIKDKVLKMLQGALNELVIADPWLASTDIGPVIDQEAQQTISAHIETFRTKSRVLFQHQQANQLQGLFVAPTVIGLDHYAQLEREIFGPVLHVIAFEAHELDQVIEAINHSGYGLTLGIHSRLDDRVEKITDTARIGNMYVNRNQIGAVVGVQPFGGEGLSGTGPKAGGPHYLQRFVQPSAPVSLAKLSINAAPMLPPVNAAAFAQAARQAQSDWDKQINRAELLKQALKLLPADWQDLVKPLVAEQKQLFSLRRLQGPTGESDQLRLHGRGLVLCLGASDSALLLQVMQALLAGNAVVMPSGKLANQLLPALYPVLSKDLIAALDMPDDINALLAALPSLALVAIEGDSTVTTPLRQMLAARQGVRVQLAQLDEGIERFVTERVISIDTTAAGGNASLLTMAS